MQCQVEFSRRKDFFPILNVSQHTAPRVHIFHYRFTFCNTFRHTSFTLFTKTPLFLPKYLTINTKITLYLQSIRNQSTESPFTPTADPPIPAPSLRHTSPLAQLCNLYKFRLIFSTPWHFAQNLTKPQFCAIFNQETTQFFQTNKKTLRQPDGDRSV